MGMMRRRMRRRVLVAGAATGAMAYHAGKNRGADDQAQADAQYADQATQYAPAPPQDTGPDSADLDEIRQLAELHTSGALTDEEFAVAKAKLLS